ncbi:MAG: hypothetical protein CMJ40_05980 [Phycisphaerae bacterium]|nr:hypothetical protein [Phycisphaerae bacterium]|tara:strand:+ start:1291 stop:1494 length:204 start_codon:yes stop_codon:yes gene_type:complete
MPIRFGSSSSQAANGPVANIYTVLALVAFLILLVGVVWMVFHNMEYSKDYPRRGTEGGVFAILEEGR